MCAHNLELIEAQSPLSLNVTIHDGYVVVHFSILNDGVIETSALSKASAHVAEALIPHFGGGIVFSGRGPIWLVASMTHEAHGARWVATFDPRLGGGIVVQRHHPSAPLLGEVVPCEA